MGLQLRPPAQPPPSSMACLQVETPAICRGKFKSVLQLRLQQRRSREQLVQQGIMPPLKTPAAFHEQIRNLERARTGNFLKHKICSRPQRAELVRMHILQETQAEPSLQATQMRLKRVRLADDLNEKIAQRPGPMELVEKNILPVAMEVQDTSPDSQDSDTKMADVYNFDEDSSDSLSAPQPDPRSQTSSSPSPREAGVKEPASSAPYSPQINPSVSTSPPDPQTASDSQNLVSTTELQENNELRTSPKPSSTAAAVRGPVLVKQSQPKAASDKSRSKKSKEPKPRVRKLKYHQYVPPDHKPELSQVPMDSAYARLLQQQQQFLQLQILSHQQQHFSYQAIQPAPLKPGKDGQSSCTNVALSGNNLTAPRALYVAGALRLHPTLANHTLDCLPTNLDEMKVAELKAELKLRGLLVSGTKNDLIERLKLYRESSNVHLASHAARTPQTELRGGNFTPPVSPIAFKVSGMGLDEKLPGAVSPSHTSPSGSPLQADPPEASPAGSWASEKDMRLREKERQIEELMRKLEQEQRLVEELKMQLEVEKRGQQEETAAHAGPPALARVKQEAGTSSNCSAPRGSPGPTAEVGQRRPPDQSRLTPPRPFFMSRQQPPRALERTRAQPQTQVLLPVRPPGSAVAIKLRGGGAELQSAATAPSFIQAPQKMEASPAASQQQSGSPTQTMTQADALSGLSAGSGCQFREQQSPGNKDKPQHLLNAVPQSGCHASTSCGQVVQGPTHKPTMILQHLKFTSPVSKCKDPPRYEDAVKQTRCMQTAVQGPSVTSQHMDDLFDVLIESGEIPPFIRQEPSSTDKLTPVTAQVTTLPINTVLSRPPPLIQVALPPDPSQDPSGSLMALVSDHNMETLLEGTLHKQLLEQSQSSLDAMQLDYSDPTPPAAFHLRNANLDTMDWLELSMPVSEGAGTPLEMSSPTGVFPSDFLDSHDMHLSWD